MEADTPDFEHCKRLKEAGWEKATHFYYDDHGILVQYNHVIPPDTYSPAPLLTELLAELPKQYLEDVYGKMDLALIFDEYGYANCGYMIGDTLIYLVSDPNPCNAAADLWIWKEKRK